MQHHKDGAETLTNALNSLFHPLVHTIYQHRGFITTFAGDAITALFPVETSIAESVQYALRAAYTIQHFFAEQGTIHTRYGTIDLGAKVGIGAGSVAWHILGAAPSTHQSDVLRAYIFRGEAIHTSAYAEQQATRGTILIHQRVWPWLPPQTQTTAVNDCYQITAIPPLGPPPVSPLPTATSADIAPFVPARVIAQANSAARGEFRQVAVAFLSFDEEVDKKTLNTFVTLVLNLTHTYEGFLNKLDTGDKGGVMLLLFGAPLAHENDPERAATMLLSLREQASGVRWRAGLTFGLVYAGMIGGAERCEYTAIGDTVNLSARLMMAAPWGDIWVGASIARSLRLQGYQLEPLVPRSLKGKQAQVTAERLIRQSPDEATAHFAEGVLVGRDDALQQAAEWISPIFRGRPAGVLLVYGEAGVGKSRFVHTLRQRITEVLRLQWFVSTPDAMVRQSLNPFKAFLRTYFGQSPDRSTSENEAYFTAILDGVLVELAKLPDRPPPTHPATIASELDRTRSFLGALLDLFWPGSLYEQLEPELRFENTLQAIIALLQAESLFQPVIFQIEDMHVLDSDSHTLVTNLSRTMQHFPFALVGTSRYRDDRGRGALVLDARVPQLGLPLAPLGQQHVLECATHMLDGIVPDDLVAFLQEKTGGNPFFVEQLLLDLRARGALTRASDSTWVLHPSESSDLPLSITALLMARLDCLEPDVRHVVQTAAVLGREFAICVLLHMIQHEGRQVVASIQTAQAEHIWSAVSESRYVFLHALMRDAAYDMQLRAHLRDMHAGAAAAIESLYAIDLAHHYAELFYHYGQAEDHQHEYYYAYRAGEQAITQFANHEAMTYLNRALELTPAGADSERYALRLLREQVSDRLGERDAQSHDLEALVALARHLGDPERQAEVALRQANYATVMGNYAAAVQAAQQTITLAQTLSHQAAGYLQWGRALLYQGENAESRRRLEQALLLARQAGDQGLEAESLRQIGSVAYYQGDYTTARAFDQQALTLFRNLQDRLGEAKTLDALGSDATEDGDYTEAAMAFEQARALYQAIGVRWDMGVVLGNIGQLFRAQGEYDRALAAYQQGLAICQTTADRNGEGWFYGNIGWVLLDLGSYTESEAAFQQARHICRAIGAQGDEQWVCTGMALLAALRGDYPAASAYAHQILATSQGSGERSTEGDAWMGLGHALAGQSLWVEAQDAYQHALDIWCELEQTSRAYEARAGIVRMLLARGYPAEARAQGEMILPYLAPETLAGTDEPFRIYHTCYEVLQASGDREGAAAVLHNACCKISFRTRHNYCVK
jgi:predicted ATPase/class 3 adenylate cyclase